MPDVAALKFALDTCDLEIGVGEMCPSSRVADIQVTTREGGCRLVRFYWFCPSFFLSHGTKIRRCHVGTSVSSPYWMRCWVVAFPVAPCRRCFRGRHPSHNADTKRSKYGKSCSRACTGPRACQLAHRSVIFTTDNIFSLKARITRTCQLLAATTRRHSRVHRRTQQRTPDTLIQWHQHTRAPTDTRQLTHRQYTHRRAHLTTLDSHHTCALYSYKAHAYVRANF